MEEGWLRLWRRSLRSRAFSDRWLWHLWSWCLLSANWRTSWKLGRELTAGQFATDFRSAARQLNASTTSVHRGMRKLQEWGQIRLNPERDFTIVTICNWETY